MEPVARSAPPEPARFIVGMSRAGTTWLSRCFNEHPESAVFGETLFWGRNYLPPAPDGRYTPSQIAQLKRRLIRASWSSTFGSGPGCLKNLSRRNLAQVINQAFDNAPSALTPGAAFQHLCAAVAAVEGKRCAIEKTPHHVNWIDRILAQLPDARFIVMVRDPYGFMLSYKHQGDRRVEHQRRNFGRLYHPAACALVWKRYMTACDQALARHPASTHRIWYGDLRTDPHGVMLRAQEFLGLAPASIADKVPPENSSFPGGVRPELAPIDVFWMNVIAGGVMRRFGFERRPAKAGFASIAASALMLPVWAVRNLIALFRRSGSGAGRYVLRWLKPSRAA